MSGFAADHFVGGRAAVTGLGSFREALGSLRRPGISKFSRLRQPHRQRFDRMEMPVGDAVRRLPGQPRHIIIVDLVRRAVEQVVGVELDADAVVEFVAELRVVFIQ